MPESTQCQICGKEAKVHLTQIVDNQVHKVDLCEECARQKGVADADGLHLADLVATAFLGAEAVLAPRAPGCPDCGLSPADFKRTGRLGCPRCYGHFQGLLGPLLGGMQRGTEHRGKSPERLLARVGHRQKVERLEAALRDAVRDERYEDAARLRDEIRLLREEAGHPA